jgi:peptidoglycan/LPS O-acetylase OafA/YrhL
MVNIASSAGIASSRIDFFDLLRAFAITLVVITHFHSSALPGGSVGVAVFFCLSGFLITRILIEGDELTVDRAKKFIVRRFFRVYPAYLLVVLLQLLVMFLSQAPELPRYVAAIPGLLTFTEMPGWIGMGTGIFWTLQIEFWFYVGMPFVVLLFGRGRELFFIVLLLILVSYAYKAAPIHLSIPFYNFFSWIDNLLYGSMAAIMFEHREIRIPARICIPLQVLLISTITLIAMYVPSTGIAWPIEGSICSLLTGILIVAFLSAQEEYAIGPLAWFGRISYSVYLLHTMPLDYRNLYPRDFYSLDGYLSPLGLVVLLSAVLAASTALHYLIEKPAMRLGRRITA